MAYDPSQFLAIGPQPQLQPDQKSTSLFGTTAVVGGIIGAGFIPTGNNKRVWDHYLNAIRTVETASPGGVLRTFRISEFLSPLESFSQVNVAPFETKGPYGAYLSHQYGEVARKGVTLQKQGSLFGRVVSASGEELGVGIGISGGTQKGTAIADYYARVAGTRNLEEFASLNDSILRSRWREAAAKQSFADWKKGLEATVREQRLIVGQSIERNISLFGKNVALSKANAERVAKGKVLGNLLRAKAASTAGRLNTLLSKPFETPIVGDLLAKLPGVRHLPVPQGTATQMFGGYVKKALLIGAAWKGLEYLDYQRAEGTPIGKASLIGAGAAIGGLAFNKPGIPFTKKNALIGAGVGLLAAIAPRFESGLFHGAATLGTDANLVRARASDTLGVTRSLKEQEEVTPGLLKFQTAAGFAGVGGLAAGTAAYGRFVGKGVKQSVISKEASSVVFNKLRDELSEDVGEKIWGSSLGKKIASFPGGSALSKVKSPFALGAIAGLLGWQALVSTTSLLQGEPLTAIPGVALLGSGESSEELQEIYSGQEEVPVRKGRWWEFGRCLMISTTCKLFNGTEKKVSDVEIGDIFIGRNYEKAEVLDIFTRHFKGDGLVFSTAFDRDNKTYVTPNHIIPVFYKNTKTIAEIPAEDIKVNYYVEIPYKKLECNLYSIDCSEIINEPVILEKDRLYASQRNWYSGKIQKSGTYSIPKKINLDDNFGRLCGYFLAEGNISFNKNNPTIVETVHAKTERWIVDDIISISEKIFGITPTVRFKKGKKKSDEGCWIVRICSAVAAKLFRWAFYQEEKYHKNNKKVPKWALTANKKFKESLIESYWVGDGHLDGNTKVISSARKTILQDIQLIGLSIGLISSISLKENNNCLGRWKLRITNNNFDSSNPPLILHEERLFAAVRSIEVEEYDDVVYDFAVDHPDHLFQAGTFLVHNSRYEGGRVEYYRPHMIHRLKTRAYQKGLYGTEEERWEHDPILHPLNALFGSDDWKYYYEKKYQYERPAPLCLHPETPILTKDGYKYIIDVTENDYVYNRYGKWTKVINKSSRHCYEEKIISIEIASDNRTIKTTPDHKILVVKNNNKTSKRGDRCREKNKVVENGTLEWIKAKDIERHDLVVIPVPVHKTCDYNKILDLKDFLPYPAGKYYIYPTNGLDQEIIDAYECNLPIKDACKKFNVSYKRLWQLRKNPPRSIERYISINKDFAYLLGIYFAEGWLGNDQGKHNLTSSVDFALHKKEQYIVDFISRYAKIVFDSSISIKESSANGISVSINSSIAGSLFKSLLGRTSARTKIIPDFVFNWPNNLKQQFIKGIFRGDGHYQSKRKKSNGCIKFSSASSGLAGNLRLLLLSVGIKSSIRYREKNNKYFSYIGERKIEHHDSYILEISGQDYNRFSKFEEQLSGLCNVGCAKGYLDDYYMYLPVRKIEEHMYNEEVYDITVEDDCSFLTTCIVHNSSTYGSDIPFIGPLVAATVGKLLKPQKVVRPEEWLSGQGPIQMESTRPEEIPSYELGGLRPGAPVNPTTDASNLFNKLTYLRREAVGLPGFIEGSINKAITGREEILPMEQELETMGKETGSEYWLWKHLNLGGFAGSTEVVRRFIPRTPSNWEFYNPLANTQPSWMPDDYFIDLKSGNPFSKIPEAEIRLPGAGFAALHPDLKGVHPEMYPLAYQVKILGDVAMWSDQYKYKLAEAKRNFDVMTPKEVEIVKTTEKQVREKKKRREFSEYRALSDYLTSESVKVRQVIDPRHVVTEEYGDAIVELQGFGAITDMEKAKEFAEDTLLGKNITISLPKDDAQRFSMGAAGPKIKAVAFAGGSEYGEAISDAGLAEPKELDDEFAAAKWGLGQRLAGGLSEGVLHNIETPLDYLTPFAPASKLIHQRSAIEEYVATQAVGTESSFWDRPMENFIEPTINMLRHKAMPGANIPESVDRKRAIQQYFDMLAWKKASMLEEAARQSGDMAEAQRWEEEKQQTVFGADVFGNPTQIMRALPRNDRDFYSAFVNTNTEEDKRKILSLVPSNQQRVYMSSWQRKAATAARAKIEAGIGDEGDKEIIRAYKKARLSEGFNYNESDLEQYQKQTKGRVPFDDYMRERIADQYFSQNALPDPSWLGFNPAVDLDDVKMIYADSAGIDFHDLDLWDARKRALARKPYISNNLLTELSTSSELKSFGGFIQAAEDLPKKYNYHRRDIMEMTVPHDIGRNRYDLQIEDKRNSLIEGAFDQILR